MRIFQIFTANIQTIALDEFAQSKLRVSELLFQKLQHDMAFHIQECPNTMILDNKHYGLIHSFHQWNKILTKVEKSEKKIRENTKGAQQQAGRRTYKKYNKPCFDYIKETVLPWYQECTEQVVPNWKKESYFVTKELLKMDLPDGLVNKDITREQEVVATGQRKIIENIFACYLNLANATPDKFDINDMDRQAIDLIYCNDVETLKNFLEQGHIDLHKSGIDIPALK